MAENYVLGKDCKALFADTLLTDTTTAHAEGLSWTAMDNVQDVSQNLEKEEADISTRGGGGWKQRVHTQKDGSVEFQMLWKPGDAGFEAVRDAWLNDTEIALAFLTGEMAGSGVEGLVSNFSVGNFSRNEPLNEAVTVSVTVTPSSYTQWYQKAVV